MLEQYSAAGEQLTKRQAKKVLIGTIGGVVTLAGVAMLVLPGPGLVVIPAGLAILASEFEWAHRWLEAGKEKFRAARQKYRQKRAARSET